MASWREINWYVNIRNKYMRSFVAKRVSIFVNLRYWGLKLLKYIIRKFVILFMITSNIYCYNELGVIRKALFCILFFMALNSFCVKALHIQGGLKRTQHLQSIISRKRRRE